MVNTKKRRCLDCGCIISDKRYSKYRGNRATRCKECQENYRIIYKREIWQKNKDRYTKKEKLGTREYWLEDPMRGWKTVNWEMRPTIKVTYKRFSYECYDFYYDKPTEFAEELAKEYGSFAISLII